MKNRVLGAVAFTFLLVVFGAGSARSVATGQDKPASRPWELKAVLFADGEKEGTKKLNELAASGWEYVGPMGNGLVAFKRPMKSSPETELEKLQGTWISISHEKNGIVSKDYNATITFSGSKWVAKSGDTVIQEGEWKLIDTNASPKTFELRNSWGGTGYGIYEVDTGTFKYCANDRGPEARPADLSTTAGDGRYCLVWKRAKP